MSRVVVAGAGGWGTALAAHLARKGDTVLLWARDPVHAAAIAGSRENTRLLPGVLLPPGVAVTADPGLAGFGLPDAAVFTVPSHGLGAVAGILRPALAGVPLVVSGVKGFEPGTFRRPSEVLADALGVAADRVCTLSGPSHAEEVGREVPTAVVAAAAIPATAAAAQALFFSSRFRVYTHSDLVGVELAGALKNVIALACGMTDGLGFGDNTRAALLTRGLAEIARLGATLGARRGTFQGLAGLGDLVVTCTSPLSRNRRLGMRLGAGERLEAVAGGMIQVAEGVRACAAAVALAQDRRVAMPISAQVHRVLFGGAPAAEALQELLTRDPRSEEETAP